MQDADPEEQLRALEVGDTLRMRLQKDQVDAEVRDRVSPILEPPTTPKDRTAFRGFRKDAGGMWDLESVTGGRQHHRRGRDPAGCLRPLMTRRPPARRPSPGA